MKEFWIKIKTWFYRARFWVKSKITGVRPVVRYVGSLVLIGLALLGTILYVRSKDDDASTGERNVEIAQVYEPSIGTPLAPDTPGENNGSVGGASTPSPTPAQAPAMAPDSGVNQNAPYVAPNTGVNDDGPVKYSSSSYKFAATLPAGTNVVEKNSSITFLSKQSSRYYTVSISPQGSETLSSIESQLKNSPSVKNIVATQFGGNQAVQFTSAESGAGVAFIKNGNIYYLLGDNNFFQTFNTI